MCNAHCAFEILVIFFNTRFGHGEVTVELRNSEIKKMAQIKNSSSFISQIFWHKSGVTRYIHIVTYKEHTKCFKCKYGYSLNTRARILLNGIATSENF